LRRRGGGVDVSSLSVLGECSVVMEEGVGVRSREVWIYRQRHLPSFAPLIYRGA
jgi:hypothetical protein